MSDDKAKQSKAKQSKEKKRKEKFSYLLSDWDEKLFYIGQRQLLVLGTRSLFDMLIFIWKLVKHLVVWAVANFSQVPCTLQYAYLFFRWNARNISFSPFQSEMIYFKSPFPLCRLPAKDFNSYSFKFNLTNLNEFKRKKDPSSSSFLSL